MFQQLMPAFRMTVLLTVLTGLIYPGVVTALAQLLFPHQANGSLLTVKGKVVGSALIGQNFTGSGYFHGRPSAAGTDGYDATASGGSNLGPTSKKLVDRVAAAAADFRKSNPEYQGPIPADALTTSGSGLDPEISIANAEAQAARIAAARHLQTEQVLALIRQQEHGRDLGFLGESRVNVLALNLSLNSLGHTE